MSGRNHVHREIVHSRHGYPSAGPYARGPPFSRAPPPPGLLEQEFEVQHAEMRRILADNRQLLEDRIALQRELSAAKEEIHRINLIIGDIRAEQEIHLRDLLERTRKLESDLRATEPLKKEAVHLHGEMQKLNKMRQDLGVQVQTLTQDVTRLKSENQQNTLLRAEIDGLKNELVHTRSVP